MSGRPSTTEIINKLRGPTFLKVFTGRKMNLETKHLRLPHRKRYRCRNFDYKSCVCTIHVIPCSLALQDLS